jgi:hypothetical protein
MQVFIVIDPDPPSVYRAVLFVDGAIRRFL